MRPLLKPSNESAASRRGARRWRWVAGGIALIVGIAGIWLFVVRRNQSATSAPVTVKVQRTTFSQTVTSSGALAPLRIATLTFGTSGHVQSVLVGVGDHVRQGQALMRLDDQAAQLALQQAQADLNQRVVALADTHTISITESDITQAQANVTLAKAQLQAAQTSASADTISGKSNLTLAQTKQATTQQGDIPAELQAAHLKTQAAEINLNKTRASMSVEKTNAQIALTAATDALKSAQQQYSDAYWLNDQVQRTKRDPNTLKDDAQPNTGKLTDNQVRTYQQALDTARLAMQQAEHALQAAQIAYDLASQQEVNAIKQAEQELDDAQQNEATTLAGSAHMSLASAQDQVVQNQAALMKQRASNSTSIASAQSSLTIAQAKLAALQNPAGPNASAIASAEAQVAEARANLFTAQQTLSATAILAPFDAIVSQIASAPNDTVAADATALTLIDMHQLTVEVALSESDIVQIMPGLAVTVQPEALAGTVLSGIVQTLPISPTFTYGAPSYPVRVVIQNAPAQVRLGMTVDITMTTLAHPGALVVPLEVVQGTGDSATVQRLVDQQTSTVPVRLGQQNDTEIEILSGVNAGDTLVLPQSATDSSTTSSQSQGGGLFGGGGPAGGPPPP